jgi:acetyl esterase/lipase
VVAAWQRARGATADDPAVTALGITLDEIGRARSDSGIPHQVLAYPLLDLGLRRADCPRIITGAGLPMPPRSACWFCPLKRPSEWARMQRQEPELFARACDLEAQLIARRRELARDPVYLTRFGRPLGEVFANRQGVLFDPEPSKPDLEACESGFCMT